MKLGKYDRYITYGIKIIFEIKGRKYFSIEFIVRGTWCTFERKQLISTTKFAISAFFQMNYKHFYEQELQYIKLCR